MRGFGIALALLTTVVSAQANDTMAELKTGGLTYVRSDAVRMVREDLFLSTDLVTVDYVFENTSAVDIDTIMAFPMPDITGNPYEMPAVPNSESGNFLGFSVHSEDVEITPELMQRATAFGLDVTNDLQAAGVPFAPFATATFDALAALDAETLADWTARGIVIDDVYDDGSGMKSHPTPVWTLQSQYWWRMSFPAGRKISVGHAYAPSVGGTAGLSFVDFESASEPNPVKAEYEKTYCMDDAFERAVQKRMDAAGDSMAPLFEQRLSYVLTTGNNWYGPIGTFHLTVDKGSSDSLVSFCGTGVEKTGPTRFVLTYSDYYPERDLDVLILKPAE